MSNRKWRNPYAPMPSKKLNDQVTPVSLAVAPKRMMPAFNLRTSVSRMRHNIKGISSTIRQVEETMDTLYGAMEIFEKLTKKPAEKQLPLEKPAPRRKAAQEAANLAHDHGQETGSSGSAGASSNPLANIDLGQILTLLQSPLVQNLLSQTLQNSSRQRKKEG